MAILSDRWRCRSSTAVTEQTKTVMAFRERKASFPRAREPEISRRLYRRRLFLGEFIATNIDMRARAHGEYIDIRCTCPNDSPFIFICSFVPSYGNVNQFYSSTINLWTLERNRAGKISRDRSIAVKSIIYFGSRASGDLPWSNNGAYY